MMAKMPEIQIEGACILFEANSADQPSLYTIGKPTREKLIHALRAIADGLENFEDSE